MRGLLYLYFMKGIIYKATNLFSGLSYIGQTVTGLNRRRSQHLRDAVSDSVNHFHLALMQYGKDAFEWEVLDEFIGEKEYVIHALNVAEEYHILKHHTLIGEFGYNATKGGYSSDKFASVIKKRALANYGGKPVLQYDLEGNFIREFESIAEVKRCFGVENRNGRHFIGRMWRGFQWRAKDNEYYPRKIASYMPKSSGRSVVVYTADGKFFKTYRRQVDCWKDLGQKYRVRDNFDNTLVRSWQNVEYLVFKNTGEYPQQINVNMVYPKEKENRDKQAQTIPVLQYSTDGYLIAEYDSLPDAHRKTGYSIRQIRESCKRALPYRMSHRTKCIWRFKEDVIEKKIDIVAPQSKTYERKLEHRILQYGKTGEFIKEYNCLRDASESTGIGISVIRRSMRGKCYKDDAFQWRFYCEGYNKNIKPMVPLPQKKRGRSVSQYNTKGDLVMVWDNINEASIRTGESYSLIYKQCLGIPTKKKTPSLWKYYTAV